MTKFMTTSSLGLALYNHYLDLGIFYSQRLNYGPVVLLDYFNVLPEK